MRSSSSACLADSATICALSMASSPVVERQDHRLDHKISSLSRPCATKRLCLLTTCRWHDRQGMICHQMNESRSEEHTSEPHSLMRISYAVFCLQKQKQN